MSCSTVSNALATSTKTPLHFSSLYKNLVIHSITSNMVSLAANFSLKLNGELSMILLFSQNLNNVLFVHFKSLLY